MNEHIILSEEERRVAKDILIAVAEGLLTPKGEDHKAGIIDLEIKSLRKHIQTKCPAIAQIARNCMIYNTCSKCGKVS